MHALEISADLLRRIIPISGSYGIRAPIPTTTNVNAKGPSRARATTKKATVNKRKRGGMLSDAVRYTIIIEASSGFIAN